MTVPLVSGQVGRYCCNYEERGGEEVEIIREILIQPATGLSYPPSGCNKVSFY